jgi:LacI family transcriptional regulator
MRIRPKFILAHNEDYAQSFVRFAQMKSSPRIAIVYPSSVPWIGQFLDGIRRFAGQYGGWRLYTTPPALAVTGERTLSIQSLVGWNGDGAIAAISSPAEAEEARKLGIPIVNISTWKEDSFGLPRVSIDNYLAGRLAAEHFVERGLKNLAYVGWEGVHYSEQRYQGFRQTAEQLGATVALRLDIPDDPRERNWGERIKMLSTWLKVLPRPCGIFAVHDYRAQLVLDACDGAGLRVPQDFAIVGMDNDTITCEHSVPTLSSISRNSEAHGWETASLIHQMLSGEKVGAQEILIQPDGVTARQSTDTQYHADEVVRVAVRFMEGRLRLAFNMEEVADHAGVSRRKLEMRFRECMGKSPHQYLTESRISFAKKLIQRPNPTPLQEIANECGFGSYSAFVAAFRRIAGSSPGDFQKELKSLKS